ncbi:MAG: hypothetical protein M1818_000065 [Claussenomyces sp. TS43310]|nr:MAG: hypothetical protein M1818_000065 [Claussenomyces sp. TS43310]
MNDWPTSRSNTTATDAEDSASKLKQAACLNCRRSKTRCLRTAGESICKRCQQTAAECVIPAYHIGRQKGIKNKRSGLDKAVYRIEQALKKSKGKDGQAQEKQTAHRLQDLLSEAQALLPDNISPSDHGSSLQPLDASPQSQFSPSGQSHDALQQSASSTNTATSGPEDILALEDAHNPLQLLAHATSSLHQRQLPSTSVHVQSGNRRSHSDLGPSEDLQTFFGPLNSNLDVGPDIDPIDMGFVTFEETDILFN